jgi:hypothetical protein
MCMDLLKYTYQVDWFRKNTQKLYLGNAQF